MMQSDPTQGAQSASGDAEQVSVTITAVGDGTFTVAINEPQDADDQSGDPAESDDEPQTTDNIDDALKMAGQMLGAEADEESQGDDNEQLSPADAKSAWSQMAGKKKQSQGA